MTKMLDPVCDMVVDLESAREQGLTLEMPDREYAFCAAGCLATFAKSPERYRAKVDAWLASGGAGHHAAHGEQLADPVLDQGMREWYKACRCCMSDAYPSLVAQLDAESGRS